MNLLNKLTIKNLKLNKKRTIVTIIGITLSVALITAVASMYASSIASLIKYETTQKGNFHVAFYDVPINDLEILKNNREIEALYLTQNIGYAKLENSKNENKPYAYIKSFTKDSLENLSVKLVEGRLPEKNDEIVIPTHLKTNGRITLNVGDTITLDVGTRVTSEGNELDQSNPYHPSDYSGVTINAKTEEILEETHGTKSDEKIINSRSITYKIVGIIERPASNIESYVAPGYTFITYMDEKDLDNKIDVYARYTKKGTKDNLNVTANVLGIDREAFVLAHSDKKLNQEELGKVDKELKKAKYEYNENSYLIALETNPLSSSGERGLGIVVVIVCGIIVFTSVFCIKNSFDISITEKIKQYGMLRSIGATKKQIKKNVFYEAIILGLIGIPLGILSGFLAAYILVIISNYLLAGAFTNDYLKLKFAFSWIAVLVAVILGIVTIYLSAIRSARKAAKVSPIDSIRNSANIKIKAKKVKGSKIINKLFGIGGDISYKNLKRNKKKYRTTVISISVSVLVFIALFSFMSLAFLTVESELGMTDYNLSLSVDGKDVFNQAIETTKLDGIKNYTIYRNTGFSIENVKYNNEYKKILNMSDDKSDKPVQVIVAIGDEPYRKYIKNLGLDYDEIKNKAILLDDIKFGIYDEEKNETIYYRMREFAYKKGDLIKGEFEKGKTLDIEIGYITDELPFGFKNAYYNSMILVSDELFDTYMDSDHCVIYYDASDASKLQDDIDEMLKDTDYYVNNIEENAKMMNNLFTLVGIFLYGFIIVISLIGITNIFNTITTNMQLRKREFAMLKSIGMTKKEFDRMIRLESIFMGMKSLFFGTPIGIVLSYLIYHALASSGVKYEPPIVAIIISIFAVFILITCIMKYSMSKINKQNTIETIRNENI